MCSLVKPVTHLHREKSVESKPLAAKRMKPVENEMANLSLYRTEVNASLWLQGQEAISEATILWTLNLR